MAEKWRLMQRLVAEVNDDKLAGFKARFVSDEDRREVEGMMKGPPDTPYEDGVFYIRFTFPSDFPVKPPEADFLTPIYHPNVNFDRNNQFCSYGHICLDTLQHGWLPTFSLLVIMLSIQQLLVSPNPDHPLRLSAADEYYRDIEAYNKRAREEAIIYAGAPEILPTIAEREWNVRARQVREKNAKAEGEKAEREEKEKQKREAESSRRTQQASISSAQATPQSEDNYNPQDIAALQQMGLSREEVVFVFGAFGAQPGERLTPPEMAADMLDS